MFVLACSILSIREVAAQSGASRTAIQNQIVADENAITKAIITNDPKTFHRNFLDDSLSTGPDGVMKAADFDKMMSDMKSACKFGKQTLSDSKFYWLSDTSVVHIYKLAVDGT